MKSVSTNQGRRAASMPRSWPVNTFSAGSRRDLTRAVQQNQVLLRTAGGGTFQGTCDTPTRPGDCPHPHCPSADARQARCFWLAAGQDGLWRMMSLRVIMAMRLRMGVVARRTQVPALLYRRAPQASAHHRRDTRRTRRSAPCIGTRRHLSATKRPHVERAVVGRHTRQEPRRSRRRRACRPARTHRGRPCRPRLHPQRVGGAHRPGAGRDPL